jgi:hypothetical protein
VAKSAFRGATRAMKYGAAPHPGKSCIQLLSCPSARLRRFRRARRLGVQLLVSGRTVQVAFRRASISVGIGLSLRSRRVVVKLPPSQHVSGRWPVSAHPAGDLLDRGEVIGHPANVVTTLGPGAISAGGSGSGCAGAGAPASVPGPRAAP